MKDQNILVHIINEPDKRHLQKVKNTMIKKGSPVVRVCKVDHKEYYALEGSHRLVAAHELGIIPIFVEMEEYETVEDFIDIERTDMIDSMVGYGEEDFDRKRDRTVADILSYSSSGYGTSYFLEFDEVVVK